MKKAVVIIAIILVFNAIFVSGCGKNVKQARSTANITITDVEGRKVSIKKNIKRIVVLNASSLNILYALGGKAVGRTETSIHLSDEMNAIPSVGNVSSPNFDKIAALKPDIVFGNMMDEKTVQTFKQLNIPIVFTRMESYQDTLDVIKLIGRIIGQEDKARSEITKIENYKNRLISKVNGKGLKTLIMMGPGKQLEVALPKSFEGDLLSMFKGRNVIPQPQGIPTDTHYIALSMEQVTKENPDLILILSHGKPDQMQKVMADQIKNNTAWKNVNAVKNNRIVYLPYDLFAVKPGIRITESMDFIVNTLYPKGN